jgi:uncharacterized small protein (DUF1192 family)
MSGEAPKWSDLFGIDPTYADNDPPPDRLEEVVAENRRLRADLALANQRIVALEARIGRMKANLQQRVDDDPGSFPQQHWLTVSEALGLLE